MNKKSFRVGDGKKQCLKFIGLVEYCEKGMTSGDLKSKQMGFQMFYRTMYEVGELEVCYHQKYL